ncbi:Signal transduction histidine kinase [Amycolatopsis arida]|uniref:histidine kinase n=1 Tax=Amycolatopsis arida TaxID=587909 RepID=A0A1I5M3L3_9PSEU|nr:signal transduction histidine kinase [Amycolatopsis arida]SFP04063.1 Signal transduction histidine kinase [Amycolatopsis arida]
MARPGYRRSVHRLPTLLRRIPRGTHLVLADTVAAGLWFTVYLGFMHTNVGVERAFTGPEWLGWLIAAGVALPVAVRRLWPIPVLGVVVAASMAAALTHLTREPAASMAFALYLVALREPTRRSATALGVALVAEGTAIWVSMAGNTVEPVTGPVFYVVFVALFGLTGWLTGFVVRTWRAAAAREAEQQAQRALVDERLRIARELHDVVAHGLSLIAVKAAVGHHVAAEQPAEARDALRVIETTTRQALVEMRHILGVLRSERDLAAELTPSPRLTGLGELAQRARLAGVEVDLTVRAGALPEGVELSVYRIVQESLTNVVKHAAPARCRVLVESDGNEVRVEVTDDGDPVPADRPAGHGLIGMRERATLYGGVFSAGPRPGGGFAVRAAIPFGAAGVPA